MKIFIFDDNYNLSVNTEEILLIKEFADLWDIKRNKTADDKTGKNRLKAFNEFKFIYLVYDWQSPYAEYGEQERVYAAKLDSELTDKDLKDPLLKICCKKYMELQDTRLLKLLRSAYGMIDKLRLFYDTVDLTERDDETGKYYVEHKGSMQALGTLDKVVMSIKNLEHQVKNDIEQKSSVKGDAVGGIFDV